ncbi:hypothetical protein [Aromatoleum bremense]|uniref:Porin n=1 Tax=Aromatoleum bremense TaxID=76115 RepID=A0ABX1NXV5_9RHOO|nr:hypothetical protein [Aromatoleum bremense]NMG16875.1 hypothetical protein [Aromatoleum bremense]QTQ33281.1 Uncharacterized protein pbN1_32950 [Aromatoleum bremense]
MKRKAVLLAALLALSPAWAEEADWGFDVSAYEKKPFEWTGFVELRPEHQWLDRDTAGYRLQYPGESRTSAERMSAAAELSGVLRHRSLSFNFTGHASWIDEPRGSDHDRRMYEAYGGWQIDDRSNLELGKRALRWGKGYAWSPVAFLERPKDPTDPELAREGFVMATGAFVRSFDGPLQTVALTAAVVPTTSGLNPEFGPEGHANPAVKLYGLILDTDVDLIWAGQGSRGPRVGIDFSRNLGSNVEIHGEWARITDARRAVLTADNRLAMEARSYTSALLGLRYLTERDTTLIFELYRNGGGYSKDELAAFYDLVGASAANPVLTSLTAHAAAQGYNRPNAARRYAYLRISQKEPFDLLDFTPALTLITNTDDHSWSLIPEALYTGITNLELRLRLALNRGDRSTEYGEKLVRSRLELRGRYFF